MRTGGARATSTVPRHLLERREEEATEDGTLVVLDELAKTLERVLDRVDEMRKQERAAAA